MQEVCRKIEIDPAIFDRLSNAGWPQHADKKSFKILLRHAKRRV
jgi:hypothetical protein